MREDQVLAVVIPAYRAENSILKVIGGLPDWVDHIVVVDDGSPDDTSGRLGSLEERRLVLIRHDQNKGVGAAMVTGYRAAMELGADIVVKLDADDQMDPAHLPGLLEPLLSRQADYTKGNRFFDLPALRAMPPGRRFGNTALTFLTKAASGYWNIADPTNGYTAIRREALTALNLKAVHPRYFFESSLLIELGIARAVAWDVPIPARYGDEPSGLSLLNTLVSFPRHLMTGAFRRLYWRHFFFELTPTAVFLFFGSVLSLFGLAFGLARWYVSWATNTPQTTGTVLLAALPFLLGFQLVLQAIVLDIQDVPRMPVSRWRNDPKPSSGRRSS